MNSFVSYILLGLSLSAPIGPINAAQLDKGIKFGFLSAWLVGIGAMAADMLFMLFIYFGIAQFVSIPIVKAFLWLFGTFVLIYTGIESIVHAKQSVMENTRAKQSGKRSFLTGFFMALSNPLNILFWLGIYGSILANTMETNDGITLLVYSSGIFIGILAWDATMAFVASTFRKVGNHNLLTFISIAAGIVLVGFGLYFGYQAVKMLFF
ncbi:LysE family transporter [Pontibacillus salicampi]|uniref:LysE family transporter n=1 Tax=Pontibacillus salicampi TaxID=1449801 RepID=A0ABV6LKL6_9BACI